MLEKYKRILRDVELYKIVPLSNKVVSGDIIVKNKMSSNPIFTKDRLFRLITIDFTLFITDMHYGYIYSKTDIEAENESKAKERYLFFDVETTGLPKNYKAPITDSGNWPRLVQIGWAIYNGLGERLKEQEYNIKPVGFIISKEVSDIHRVTHEIAMKTGKDLLEVITEFQKDAESSTHLVAHNINFDIKIIGAELHRMELPTEAFMNMNKICTMLKTVSYCKIPGKFGYKWAKLEELYEKLFGEAFEDAHNALVDVKAMVRCFWKLKEKAIL